MTCADDKSRNAEGRGRRSELLASFILMLKGYRILGRRVRNRFGEIDLVARSPSGILCFIEVKGRKAGETPLQDVHIHQQMQIGRAAQQYISQWPACDANGVR